MLFRLVFTNSDMKSVFIKDKLDTLFIVLLVQIKLAFKQKILNIYKLDLN